MPTSFGISNLIPGYRILRALAQSDRSAVYLAHSEELASSVALKVLKRGSEDSRKNGADPASRSTEHDRFVREYRIIAALRHRAIVDVYDFDITDRLSYIATEYFPAGDLSIRLRNPVSGAEAEGYILQIASALQVVHAAGVLHRDLKPANVMLRADNSPVLIDFGLAKVLSGTDTLTGAGEIRGSPYYMSPEQTSGAALDERSDLYSLGVIFYELLTGERPFKGRSVFDILAQHQQAPIPPLPPENRDFQPIVHRLLAKNPADRYQSADGLLKALNDKKL